MMFPIKARVLKPVKNPTINIKTWFLLFSLSFLTKVIDKNDKAPPMTKVIPKKNAATSNVI